MAASPHENDNFLFANLFIKWAGYERMRKGYCFSVKGIRKHEGVPFLSKWVYKRVRGWTLRRGLPAYTPFVPGLYQRRNKVKLCFS